MIFKHPLFWKEWKIAKWWSSLMIALFMITFLSLSHSLTRYQERILGPDRNPDSYIRTAGQGGPVLDPVFLSHFNSGFRTLILMLIPIIIVMSMMLFQNDRREGVGMFISSLPFTKKEQFKVKWFVGVLAFTIPFLIGTALTISMHQVNIGWIQKWYSSFGYEGLAAYDRVGLVIGILVQSYLFIVAFFSVLMLMQSLIGNTIAASIMGAIIVAVPWFILEAGGSTLSRILDTSRWRITNNRAANLYYFITPPRDHFTMIEFGQSQLHINPVISTENYMMTLIVLIIMSLIASFAAIMFYEKNETSRNGYLLIFPWMRPILVLGVALCSGLLGNNLIRQFIRINSASYELMTFAISALLAYVLMSKVITRSEKYGV